MAERRRWPDHAEAARIDVISYLDTIKALCRRQEMAQERGDHVEVARIRLKIYQIAGMGQEALREAKRGTYDAGYSDSIEDQQRTFA